MNKLFGSITSCVIALAAAGSAQAGASAPASVCPPGSQVDCNWLTVDSTAKTATFALTAGQTALNSGLNFNGFNEGKLTLTVPVGWNVVLRFTNKDQNLTHSAEVVDTASAMPAGPVDPPAFPRAMTVKLMQGLSSGDSDTVRFVAGKAGSYMIFCGVPGHGLAGMWIRLKVSATDKRPTLATS
ncbi:MAG TPA: sulfocyanin-like copper-binding protein [Gemmatimonadales bacterium]|jgi:sulfocyanin